MLWTPDETFLPQPQPMSEKPPRKYICAIDRQTCIVMRNQKAVRLGYIQFAIFRALHEAKTGDKKVMSNDLFDMLYGSAKKNPAGRNTLAAICSQTNVKLKHIGLKIRGTNRNRYSFYQLIVL